MEYEYRDFNVDGVDKLLWPCEDSGLWIGPTEDWQSHHKHKIMLHCSNFRVAVQAGGACGMYPRLLSNIFNVIYTFEPDPHNFHCLVNNCQKENIIKFNSAVGPEPGLISMKIVSETNMGAHRIEERVNSFIPRLTIDTIPYQYCDLLMLDIERYEGEALKGAVNTIKKFKPVVFVELGEACNGFMEGLGYQKAGNAAMDSIYVPYK